MDDTLRQATGMSHAAAPRRLDTVPVSMRRAGGVPHHIDLFSDEQGVARPVASLRGADAAVLSRVAGAFGAEIAVLTTHLSDALRPDEHVQAVFAKRDRSSEVLCGGFRYHYVAEPTLTEVRVDTPVHLPDSRSGQEILSTLDRCLAGAPIGADSVVSSAVRHGVLVLLYGSDARPASGQWIDTEHGLVSAPKGTDLDSARAHAQTLTLT